MERIEVLRREIDGIDKGILELLEERVKAAKKIGEIKREKGMEIEDVDREGEILDNILNSTNLNREFVGDLFRKIIEYCKNEE
ncbi:MAG: chorismate mutase [Candidatus Altiarchaeales archaeon]|nr:chorismate mutase [Candidatus Altiarchaeota archaeon]MBU4266802.1 chorismate mutase [Candidatus Altiarchaeota archaeon]MBU4406557.1 chorismate mutase [Candidatus Altiarchaeota archaeon]MBU4437551.1 chorismate mutase [Candidatus Altiarchaeota archaeon]MCG2783363.1 chorismate mutase [Candidatus Altiarchaeales archaeon]